MSLADQLRGLALRGLASLQVQGFSRLDGGASISGPAQINGVPIDAHIPLGTLPSGYATAVADQAITGATLTDITGLNVTVPVGLGRRIKVSFVVPETDSVANDGQVGIFLVDVTANVTVAEWSFNNTNLAAAIVSFVGFVVLTPASGSRNYKLQIQRLNGAGNLTVKGTFQQGCSLLIEDIGI